MGFLVRVFCVFCDSDRDQDECDRDQDEQFPRSGRRLIAIKLSVDRDLVEGFGDRDPSGKF